ncbi:hypothetical protein LTR37_010105 [Vermiconidia calcicola]|uniref:Uncharacterized protein n=1 Tax=Vermiconidia calcicola TaxID=1690605 RepID=A0ACC3N8I8_9PEZI|nr:hypothetical protein LTR37_010105 [Vermiconidia calcicola]
MIQPTRVLPSNAPPLRDGDGLHHTSKVLQEHSGNRQNDLDFSNDYEQQNYPASLLNENAFPRHHQPQQQQAAPQHLYHPQPQHRHHWKYSYVRGGYRYPSAEDEARIHFDSERLYRRFRQSDQYIKYRNRQSKDDKGNGDQKWPDTLEKAFFTALVRYPPMGRRKQLHKDKQRGRNELIADHIKELTGVDRSRKQVSSHIQVLKPFVEGDPLIMRWLSKEDMGLPARSHGHSSAYGGGRRMSNYPVTALPHAAGGTAMPTLPRSDGYNIQKLKHNLDIFEPMDFQMFVQQKQKGPDGVETGTERLHTYTQSVATPLGPDLPMNDWQTVDRDFPLLSALYAQRRLDCNVLVAEASLAFPTATFKGADSSPLPGVELGISFLCSSRYLPSTPKGTQSQVISNNSFYEGNVCVQEYSESTEVRFEPSDALGTQGQVETQIKFGSKFWARTLGRLGVKLLDTSKDSSEDIASSIKGLTAVQEIIVRTETGPERILVIHWRFRHSTHPCGRASWRKLLLPVQPTQDYGIARPERADSFFEPYTQYAEVATSQYQQQAPQPALQSPFEYDNSSGSALSSATWPTSIGDGSLIGQPADFSADNNFDFNAGNINITYDPNINFDGFDSSAFNFDPSTGDFAADPALQDFSQPWCDGQAGVFDAQPNVGDGASFSTQPAEFDAHGHAYGNGYGAQFEHHPYGGPHDQQAYGGAGQDVIKDEDALAALADASSYMASALGQKQAAVF